jgi:hypothetical protein
MKSGRHFVLLLLTLSLSGTAGAQFGFRGGAEDRALVDRYDQDGDGYLSREERDRARGSSQSANRSGGLGQSRITGSAVSPDDVRSYDDEPLYDLDVLRTIFIDFEYPDWESELEAFYSTDVEVPATITVDGSVYPDVGIHFRGNSSYRSVSRGRKRSLNLSMDHVHDEQRLLGYRTLNLLNGFGDPTFLRNVLYLQIANEYYPAPKANFVRVVINGEDWGIYINVQQFNSDFTREVYDSNEARWRVPGSFSSRGGLEYLGDNVDVYRSVYSIKNKDRPENWEALMELIRVLNQTPPERLVEELEPILDIDETLRFLAIDIALLNSDGYWARNSDYSIYRDEDGRFHITAYDANEALRDSSGFMGRRFRGGGGADGIEVSPLQAMGDRSKALIHRLLAVPELRARYLEHIRDIAENWLDWERIEPLAERYQALIGEVVADDTHKLYSTEDFTRGVAGSSSGAGFGGPGAPPASSLKSFFERRQAYLLRWLDANATVEPDVIAL